MAFYPMWRLKFARDAAKLRARWPLGRRAGWEAELDAVRRHISAHGAACSLDVGGDDKKASSGWWDWHPSKTALEFLWRSGELAICHRKGFRKFYDLSERVIPPDSLNSRMEDRDTVDWAMSAALDRLGFGTSGELAAFFDIVTRDEAKAWCGDARAAGRIIEVEVQMADGAIRRSYATEAICDSVAGLPAPSGRVRVLSPFDPALRDRARAERLFGFHYRIEIFVPEAKRQYGYYVFPVLQGDRLIGRLDAKRDGSTLAVRAFWPEVGVRMGEMRRSGLIAELNRIKSFTGLEHLNLATDWMRA